jgi:hypothetical protein
MGSRTSTSGAGRDKFAREGAKLYDLYVKGGTSAIWKGFTTVPVGVCLCFEGGHLGVFGATGVGVPVEEV